MKKTILTTALMPVALATMLFVSCKGEKKGGSYTISGNVPSQVAAEWIYLYDVSGKEPVTLDSARIENTAFKFKGVVPDTTVIVVLHPGKLNEYPAVGWNIFLEKGDIVVDSSEQFVTGTAMNDGFKDWMTAMNNIMMTGRPSDIKDFFAEHWSEHSGDFVGSFVLYAFSPYLDFPFVDSLTRDVPEEVRQTTVLKPFFEQIESIRALQPGKMFTDVKMTYMDGSAVALSDIIGKGEWVLVDFWASWCGPCRQTMPELQTIMKRHKDVKVYGIAVSDKEEDTRRAIADLKIEWPVISDPEGASVRTYGISAIPAMVLFGPDGKIAARDFTVSSLEGILEEMTK